MRNKSLVIFLFALFASVAVFAQTSNPYNQGMMSTSSPMMQTGSPYSSHISPVGASSPYETMNGPSNRRNSFITPEDVNQSEESPVGEPYVLVLFAAVAAGAVYIKRQKAAKE